MSNNKLIVKIPKKTQEHIQSVEGNIITVDFSSRYRYQDFSNSPIVIGSNPTPNNPTIVDSDDDTPDDAG